MMTILVSPVYFWLIVLIVCLIVESLTPQLVTIWFAAGSVGAMIAAYLGASPLAQFGIFLLLSIVMLAAFRPMVRGILKTGKDKTNADRILDQKAVVTQTIDNRAETGQIRVMGQIWTARSLQDNTCFQTGDTVIVRSISGVKAMVEPYLGNGGKPE